MWKKTSKKKKKWEIKKVIKKKKVQHQFTKSFKNKITVIDNGNQLIDAKVLTDDDSTDNSDRIIMLSSIDNDKN